MNLEEVKTMMESWRWNLVFHTIHSVGHNLNGETWRMMKGEVVNFSLERASNGDAIYADRIGYDLVLSRDISPSIVKIEVKSMEQIFCKDWRDAPRNTLKDIIQLKNTRGKIQGWRQTFDYLLLVQTVPPFIASVVPWEVVDQHIKKTGDQLKIGLKEEEMTFITPKDGFDIDFEIPEREKGQEFSARRVRNSELPRFNLRLRMISLIRTFLDEVEQISRLESD